MRVGGSADSSAFAASHEASGSGWPAGVPASDKCDANLGRLFQDARTHLHMTQEELAQRLSTTGTVVAIFEAGAIGALPPWPETRRVVEGYAGLVRFDPGPLLAHLETQARAQAARALRPVEPAIAIEPVPTAAARTALTVPASQRAAGARRARWHGWRRFWPAITAGAVVLGLAAGFYWAAFARPAALLASIAMLPVAIATPIRAAMDGLVAVSAPRRDGLRWIDVDDPRTRKADKLRINAE